MGSKKKTTPGNTPLPKVARPPERSRDPGFRRCIEFIRGTPLEYLTRWRLSNGVFGDEVELIQVIEWSDGDVSFAVRQPQYHGEPAADREIERFFRESGRVSITDPAREHELFFNCAYNVLAIDAVPRNCYVREDRLALRCDSV